jgi:hypothetical protein
MITSSNRPRSSAARTAMNGSVRRLLQQRHRELDHHRRLLAFGVPVWARQQQHERARTTLGTRAHVRQQRRRGRRAMRDYQDPASASSLPAIVPAGPSERIRAAADHRSATTTDTGRPRAQPDLTVTWAATGSISSRVPVPRPRRVAFKTGRHAEA